MTIGSKKRKKESASSTQHSLPILQLLQIHKSIFHLPIWQSWSWGNLWSLRQCWWPTRLRRRCERTEASGVIGPCAVPSAPQCRSGLASWRSEAWDPCVGRQRKPQSGAGRRRCQTPRGVGGRRPRTAVWAWRGDRMRRGKGRRGWRRAEEKNLPTV